MSRTITFSRHFPAHHPKKGKPTYFVEHIHNGLQTDWADISPEVQEISNVFYVTASQTPKHHTIRSGNRWRVGDKFSPRVWSGLPYRSKQIIIAPDITIVKTWEFKIVPYEVCSGGTSEFPQFTIEPLFFLGNQTKEALMLDSPELAEIAKNDGLSVEDFTNWFLPDGQKFIVGIPVFEGQILCWNPEINY